MTSEKISQNWYHATFSFKTPKGTIALAHGWGSTHAQAIKMCFLDIIGIKNA